MKDRLKEHEQVNVKTGKLCLETEKVTKIKWNLCCATLSCSDMSNSLRPPGLQPACLLCPQNSPGKNTEVGSHALLQGVFQTQGLNAGLLHCRCLLYYVNHQGSPRILEQVAYSFSRGTSQIRNRTGVSCITCEFFTSSATRKKESEVAQLCPTLCDPMDCSRPGSSIHGIFLVRILEWVAVSFSKGSSLPRDQTQASHIAGKFFTI